MEILQMTAGRSKFEAEERRKAKDRVFMRHSENANSLSTDWKKTIFLLGSDTGEIVGWS